MRALGTAEIDVDGVKVTPASARKFAILLYLTAEAGRRVSRSALHELIYPDQTEKNARHSVRQMAYQLRQAGVQLDGEGDTLCLDPTTVSSDASVLDELGERGFDARSISAIEAGFLPGYEPSHSEAFTEWLGGYRAKYTRRITHALLRLSALAKAAGDWQTCERAARACLGLDPSNDDATFKVAEMLALGGSKTQALHLLDEYANSLGDLSAELRLQVKNLRRRISERLPERAPLQHARRFVGRAGEMRVLDQLLLLVRRGGVRLVIVHGEAGIGKTRLSTEFSSQAALAGCRVVRIGARPTDREHPMAGIMELVPQLLGLPGALGCAPESMKLLNRLTRHDPAASQAGGSEESSELVAVRMHRAITDLIDAVAAETTLVILVDDAHWLDDLSRGTLRNVATRTDSGRLLILLNARPEAASDLLGEPDARILSVPLGPLAPEFTSQLVSEAFTPASEADQELQSWICDASRGNPFYIDCLVAHVESTGEQFVVPRSISDLVDRRLDMLSPNAAQVLSGAAALDKYATLERLIQVIELPTHSLIRAVEELERNRLILANNVVQVGHWLIADGISRRSTDIASRILHRRIATILQRDATRLRNAGMYWACAEHWAAAGDERMAARTLETCAEHSLDIGRARESAESLLRAAAFAQADDRPRLVDRAVATAARASESDVVIRAMEMLDRSPGQAAREATQLAVLTACVLNGHEVVEIDRSL